MGCLVFERGLFHGELSAESALTDWVLLARSHRGGVRCRTTGRQETAEGEPDRTEEVPVDYKREERTRVFTEKDLWGGGCCQMLSCPPPQSVLSLTGVELAFISSVRGQASVGLCHITQFDPSWDGGFTYSSTFLI